MFEYFGLGIYRGFGLFGLFPGFGLCRGFGTKKEFCLPELLVQWCRLRFLALHPLVNLG